MLGPQVATDLAPHELPPATLVVHVAIRRDDFVASKKKVEAAGRLGINVQQRFAAGCGGAICSGYVAATLVFAGQNGIVVFLRGERKKNKRLLFDSKK